jgi:hypothetical protein
LGKVAVSGMKGSDQSRRVIEHHFNSGADRIAVRFASPQSDGQPMMAIFGIIPHQPNSRCGSICQPEVQVTIPVPIRHGDGAAIVNQI